MSRIPHFPHFSKLKIVFRPEIEKFVGQFPPYSDFNFTSLWTYNTEDQIELSLLNGNLVVLFQDYIDNSLFYSFLGRQAIIHTVSTLLSLSIKKGYRKHLKLVPETVVLSAPALSKHFKVREDHDNHDYILSTNELSDLSGKKYYDKRNLVNRFRRKFPEAEITFYNLMEKNKQAEMIRLFNKWAKEAKRSKKDTENELVALKRLFLLSGKYPYEGVAVYHKGRMIGFATFELEHDKYGIISFEKGLKTYDGIFSVLNHETAKKLLSVGCLHINYEQDLGREGLKKAKTLWRPVHFLKKYIILAAD